MTQPRKCIFADSSGAAMVEFVFAIPILLFFVIGIIEIGAMVHYYHAVTDGSRAAARYLSRVEDPCDPDELNRAASLASTRTSDWSGDPLFADWPGSSSDLGGNFRVFVSECSGSIDPGDTITFVTSYQYNDPFGVLLLLGTEPGFWLNGVHQEVHIGA